MEKEHHMNLRKLTLTAVAAFVFAGSAVAAHPPLNPCRECRIAYNVCMSESGGPEDDMVCESDFSTCLISAGCPLE